MLDTRFKQYQDAVISTVLTTLHAGSVLLTFYPNFNRSLQDPNLPTTLKVQVQIQGAEQISSAKIATLHHQLVYRLQNHALDLSTPEHHSDTLMVLAESDQIPTIIQIPRQIPRHELIKLMPLEWISNYEHCSDSSEDLPITGFNSQGYPVYPAKHNGHFLWDAPGSGMCDPNCPCWDDWEEDDDYATTRKKKPKKKKPPIPCHHCDPKPPSDPPPPPARLPIYRKELKWIAKHCKYEIPSPLSHSTPIVQPLACMMFSSTSSDYSSSFPPLEPHTDSQRNVVSKPFVPSPITSTGHLKPPKPFESVLNWQTQNARAQNDTLLHLNSKVENISLQTEQIETKVDSITAQMQQIHQNLHSRIGQLNSELRAMLAHRYNGPEFDQKEREIRHLKAELAQIESEKQRPTLFTTSPPIPSIGPTYHPFAPMLSPIKQYDPSKLFGMTHTLFRDNPLPPPPKPKPKPRPQPRPAPLHPSSLTIPGQPSPSSTPTSPLAPFSVPTQSKDKEPMTQFTAHTVTHSSTTNDQTSDSNLAVSDSPTETDTESSASTSDSEKSYADITKILIAQPDQPTQGQTSHTEPYVDIPSEVEDEMHESSATNHPPPAQTNPSSQKSSNGPWFTFDDLPSHKWRDRLYEMSAWIDLQMLRTGATTQSVLREFATRFTVFEAARRDYLNMKCCSLNAKDLDFHYKRMSLLFYKLNGFNEPTLKHVFLASLPDELQPDIQRQLTASNLSLDNISLGKIFQLAKTCLNKLCEQKQFFKELLKDKEPFRSACKKPYLQIKCHKKKDCDCSSKKKRHFRKFKTPEFSSKPHRSRKPYRFFRKKSSSSREFKRKQSSRCFICKRKGHYAKDCPNKREKSIRLVEHLQATTDYSPAKDELEFYFSEQDEPNDETVFALQNSSDSDSSHDEHRQLLTQFYDILQSHGIMLSAKKSTIATTNIEFLGMVIKDGHYQPRKHIAQELLHFPDQKLSKRQIQQFLGIINYIRDFIPHVDHYTHHLSALLKKKPPEWNADHTIAVTTLKQIAQNPPPLKLITDGQRILQTDASDESWGAILLEELNDKEHFIAYASGQFSDTQKHYHSVFREILALSLPQYLSFQRLSKPENPLTLFSTTYHFPIISMATSQPPEALTKKTFPFNKNFSSVFAIQEFARKALFRFFMKAYLVTDPFPFSTFHPENMFLTGLTLDPTRDTTEDVLWYIWCLTVLYATKLVLPISPTLDHLLNPENATSLTWTLLEWFSPIPWWRKKLQQLFEIYNLDRIPAPEAQMFTSVFIIHRPYFQHPDTNLFWTQDQVYEWFTAPHIAVIENDIQDVLHNYLCQLNHQPPPLKDISHTSLGPQHDILMIPTPSAISKPKSTGIIIKEERPNYTDFLYQDSQDPWEDFLPLSQHLHEFPQPTMDEPGPSELGSSSQPSKADKATQMPSPKSQPSPSKPGYRRDCPYPPCRGPNCKHPKLSKTFFPKQP
ncbi:hypothetical protein KPL71_023733 [Citrus sinensis]|uniref:Uncharacterized protein n=1 Tax=Citrus sinensis TaxID=2711 RepID=A0ACB8IL88_CITSI|nr:hypothetical protein KPL71_023733 [Citrus sinensis]